MSTADYFRECAEKCKTLANNMTDPGAKARVEELVDQYELTAQRLQEVEVFFSAIHDLKRIVSC
jgi:hypothetical protein